MKNATHQDNNFGLSQQKLELIITAVARAETYIFLMIEILQELPDFLPIGNQQYIALTDKFTEMKTKVSSILGFIKKDFVSQELKEILKYSSMSDFRIPELNGVKSLIEIGNGLTQYLCYLDKITNSVEKNRVEAKKELKEIKFSIEKILKNLNTFSSEKEIEFLGIQLVFDGNILMYKNFVINLTEKEEELIEQLLSNGATLGKKLKEVDKDESNLQKTKNGLNKKVKDTVKTKHKLLPKGGYYLNKIFHITKKA